MPLNTRDATLVLDLVEGLHAADSMEALAVTCRAGLAKLVGYDICDVAVIACGDPADEIYLGTPGGYTPDMIRESVERCLEHPVVAAAVTAGDGRATRVSDLMGLTAWRATAFYAAVNGRRRQDYEILALSTWPVSSGLGGLGVSRSGRDFSARDCAVVDRLRGHLGLALRRLRADEQRLADPPKGVAIARLSRSLPVLTPREAEVLYWLTEGKRDAEIARILGVSPHTASTHVKNLLAKLHVENRLAAAAEGLRVLARG